MSPINSTKIILLSSLSLFNASALECAAPVNNPPRAITLSKQAQQKARQLYQLFKDVALTYDIDQRTIDPTVNAAATIPLMGEEAFVQKIAALVEKNLPISMNFVGFPYKSSNTVHKVVESTLDGAEWYALTYLQDFLSNIKAIYSPGAKLTIFTDGLVFCDLEGVSDPSVLAYEDALKKLTKESPDITIVTIGDLLPGQSPQAIRALVDTYPPLDEEFSKKKAEDPQLQEEIHTLEKRTVFELNHPQGQADPLALKGITEKLVLRSQRYSKFLATHREPHALRLSVHFQKDISQKFGIKLSANSYVTPWHGILVEEADGSKNIVHRSDVALAQYESVTALIQDVPCPYFKRRRSAV